MGKRRNGQRGLQIDNSFTQDTSVITEHFANYFYQASSGNSSTDQESGETGWDQNIQVSENTRLDTDFTIYELLRAIDVTNGHSTGEDQVGYLMIKHLSYAGKLAMLKSFNKVWEKGEFPTAGNKD